MMQLQPVILCGGKGTRLWPLSREDFPKQFLTLGGAVSLLEATMRRLGREAAPICVTSAQHRHLVRATLDSAGLPGRIILEPSPRNTAPAIAAAAILAGPQSILAVMPSDHVVADDQRFGQAIARAALLAEAGWICVAGVEPLSPSQAFGYIVQGEDIGHRCARVLRFAEKPDHEKAVALLGQGALWNAGIVVGRASVIIAALAQHAPEVLKAVEAAVAAGITQGDDFELDPRNFAAVPPISFDHAVLERHTQVGVTRLDAGWRDVGTWGEVAQLFAPDQNGNRIHGEAVDVGSESSFIYSPHRLTVALGLKDIMVVDTPDALLVAHADAIGRLSEAVMLPKVAGHKGSGRCQTQRVLIRPGCSNARPPHDGPLHWIVVSGAAQVSVNGSRFNLGPTESKYVPPGTRHDIVNPGPDDLDIIEMRIQ